MTSSSSDTTTTTPPTMPSTSYLRYGKSCDSKRIICVGTYKAKMSTGFKLMGRKMRLYNLFFLICYAYQVTWVLSTIGEPYHEFLKKADREGFQVMEGSARLRAELYRTFDDINDPQRRIKPIGWTDWMNMDIEELAEEKKRDRERNVLDSLPKHMRVPSRYSPAFWPTLILGILSTIHALVLLMQHWSVSFNVWINFQEMNIDRIKLPENMIDIDWEQEEEGKSGAKTIGSNKKNNSKKKDGNNKNDDGASPFPDRLITNVPNHLPTHVRIVPSKPGSRHVLLPIEYYPTLGMTFEYHRRRYVYQGKNNNKSGGAYDDDDDGGTWSKIRCYTNFHITSVLYRWIGFRTLQHVVMAQIRYGCNVFKVKQPTFLELYKAQLLNPFAVFQIFCVLLWAIDDLLIYSLFSLFMVLVFEGTVVFQRIKSLQALRGMGNPTRIVHVHRYGQWIKIDTTELLPGDIMSLTLVKPKKKQQQQQAIKDKATDDDKKTKPPTSAGGIIDDGGDIIPADLLLLRGSTVVNEASLTGESVPQMKEGISIHLMEDNDDDEKDSNHQANQNGNSNSNNNAASSTIVEHLDMKGRHKMNVAYAGTKMLQCKGTSALATTNNTNNGNNKSAIPDPPDNGCVCFVLRTGFASAQGKLVRMIEGSQEKVKGHERETGLLLLLLCFFAIISSSYVLYHGVQNEHRSKYELLLHCILIVTSVIRPELPMQMAMAVNNSLLTLMKMHVFCTEPYKVPMAGKLHSCLFDKTGTLTTDELVAVGICEPKQLLSANGSADNKSANKAENGYYNKRQQQNGDQENDENNDNDDDIVLTGMSKANGPAALVLAGCHSLLVFEGETTGDPLESSAMNAMRWQLDANTGFAIPRKPTPPTVSTANNTTTKSKSSKPPPPPPPPGTVITMSPSDRNNGGGISQVEILARHHFSSKLQRMSCVIKVYGTGSNGHNNCKYTVAKGSPEAVGKLLRTKPNGYDVISQRLAKRGYRVISLAYKLLNNNDEQEVKDCIDTRSDCESNLVFAGFIAFTCMVRKDTASVLRRLREGGMNITMVTGDALLTAIHVAKEVNIIHDSSTDDDYGKNKSKGDEKMSDELKALLDKKRGNSRNGTATIEQNKRKKKKGPSSKLDKKIAYLDMADNDNNNDGENNNVEITLFWRNYDDGSKIEDYIADDVPRLAMEYDLATSGKCLAAAYEYDPQTTKILEHIKVFARMTPDAKETVIECLHSCDLLCLMCGDGANDVGALKQADVGVALLSGFGNVNVDRSAGNDDEDDNDRKKTTTEPEGVTAIISREHLDQIRALPVSVIKMKIKQLGCDPARYPDLVEKDDLIQLYQIKAREHAVKKHDKKNALDKKRATAAEQAAERRANMADKQRRMQQRTAELEAQGDQWAAFTAMREFWAAEMEEAKQKGAELKKNRGIEGSAALMAAHFGGAGDDGTAAAPGELPMVKLGDASIAAPFTSKMPSIKSCVDIVRQGRCTLVSSTQMYQIMALQCLISSYSLSVLYLDGVKYGDTQMTLMGVLGSVSYMSISRSKPLDKLSSVRPLSSIFHPALIFSLLGQFAIHLTTMLVAVQSAKGHLPPDYDVDLDGTFKPGILNTVVFLVSSVQQVTVFVVNLQGRPFMTGVTDNTPLLYSLVATFMLTFMFASESVPGLNRYFQLVAFPDDAFRDFVLTILVMDLVATFTFDRLMQFFFCRDILAASFEGMTTKDVMGLLRTLGIVGFLMYSFMGNSETWDELLAMEEEAMRNATAAELDDAAASVVNTAADDAMVNVAAKPISAGEL